MNAFARYLFQAMFGWVREAVRRMTDPGVVDGWLAVNWAGIVIMLLLAGTLIDFAVWFIRWRPDWVWRGHFGRAGMRLRAEERQMRRFRKGFDQDNEEIGAIARPLRDAPAPEAAAEETDTEEPLDAYYDWQYSVSAEPADAPETRHRRGDRYRRRDRRAEAYVEDDAEPDEEEPVYGLPPVVRKDEAFRAPVYPRSAQQDQDS